MVIGPEKFERFSKTHENARMRWAKDGQRNGVG